MHEQKQSNKASLQKLEVKLMPMGYSASRVNYRLGGGVTPATP